MKPQSVRPRFDMEKCVACTICVDACPVGVLDLEIYNSVHGFRRYPVMLPEKKCTGCGNCESDCPTGAVKLTAVDG